MEAIISTDYPELARDLSKAIGGLRQGIPETM